MEIGDSSELVSIIINNYNYDQFLVECLESALNQNYEFTEIIVVDDGSTDNSKEILKTYHGAVTVIFKENGGQASAFNSGIERAKGKYILLLDSDDRLRPETIVEGLKNIPKGYSRVGFQYDVIDRDGKLTGKSSNFPKFDGSPIDLYNISKHFPSNPTSANLFNGSLLRSILPIPEDEFRICADKYVFIKTGFLGNVNIIENRLIEYRIHGENNFAGSGVRNLVKRTTNQINIKISSQYLLEREKNFLVLDNWHMGQLLKLIVCKGLFNNPVACKKIKWSHLLLRVSRIALSLIISNIKLIILILVILISPLFHLCDLIGRNLKTGEKTPV